MVYLYPILMISMLIHQKAILARPLSNTTSVKLNSGKIVSGIPSGYQPTTKVVASKERVMSILTF